MGDELAVKLLRKLDLITLTVKLTDEEASKAQS